MTPNFAEGSCVFCAIEYGSPRFEFYYAVGASFACIPPSAVFMYWPPRIVSEMYLQLSRSSTLPIAAPSASAIRGVLCREGICRSGRATPATDASKPLEAPHRLRQ